MINAQPTPQSYNAVRVPNPNQPRGEVWNAARQLYLDHPFLPQKTIAKILKVSTGRVSQICEGLDKERKEAQKREIEQLREKYLK